LGHDAKGEGKQHPSPVHFVEHNALNLFEIKAAIHPIQYRSAEEER